jgi:hypothetical protein
MTSLGFGRLLYKWVLLYSRDLPNITMRAELTDGSHIYNTLFVCC